MKNTKKITIFVLSTLLLCSLLLGCVVIPEEYTKGVRPDSDYPDDDMPIMDDAIVYFSEGGDEEITIKYGVSDDLDDVVDFYKDHFEDNDIVLTDESDKSTKYTAEGIYQDFMFEIRVTKPSGEHEEKQFVTTVKVVIEFVDVPEATVEPEQSSLEDDIIGFWRQESFEDADGKVSALEYGIAYEYLPDGTLNLYINFEFITAVEWAVVDDSSFVVSYDDGTEDLVNATFERRSGQDYLIYVDSDGTLVFFLDTFENYEADGDAQPTPQSSDEQLAASIADVTWYYVHYKDVDGQIVSTYTGELIYYSDGTLEDTFDGETLYGNWYVQDGWLYCDYSDDTSSSWVVEFKLEGGTRFLYYYSSEAPAYWLYSDDPSGESTVPTSPTIFTTDADIITFITDVTWHELYYLYADGSTEPMTEVALIFSPDGTFEETFDGVFSRGTWYVEDGFLYLFYTESEESYYYPVFIEQDTVSESYYLYFGDLEEGYEGCNWIFTTYEP
ncbi:MAG: hypothetical protein HN389_08755 [Clostridia bacterium]|nr:hypothetical protein [Clostridia bacterium]